MITSRRGSPSLVVEFFDKNPFEKYEMLRLARSLTRRNKLNEVHVVSLKNNRNKRYAMKFTRVGATMAGADSLRSVRQLRNEVDKLRSMDHPNIIKVFEAYDHAKSLYIVSEYPTGGSIVRKNDRTSEHQSAKVVEQLLSAVRYMHDHNVIHGDLRPESVVYCDGTRQTIKVVDFTLARFTVTHQQREQSKPMHSKFLSQFSAPETVERKEVSPKSDMWSIGVIAFVLLSGSSPFQNMDDYADFITGNVAIDFDAFGRCSGFEYFATDFVKRLLRIESERRMDSHEAQRHLWIKYHNTSEFSPVDKPDDRFLMKGVVRHIQAHAKDPLMKKAALTVSTQSAGFNV